MTIGVLTFYREMNFGANLQALSTYRYLLNNGHTPVFILYYSEEKEARYKVRYETQVQSRCHLDFVDSIIKSQTAVCHNAAEVESAIRQYGIDAVIIGSDAVLQHYPLIQRIHKRNPFVVSHFEPERMFPNPFWGDGFNGTVPTAMMSVSCQNSKYRLFPFLTKRKMRSLLSDMRFISVRDTWTLRLMRSVWVDKDIHVTPDPVFAFNSNASDMIPSESTIREKYSLPEHYVLVCLYSQSVSRTVLSELKSELKRKGKDCVAFPMPSGIMFQSDFEYKIDVPLPPLDWYALIKYADAYIGSNMHPIIVSLHNSVPCFSIDQWGSRNFLTGKSKHDLSSKVEHIMDVFGLLDNYRAIERGKCKVTASEIVSALDAFPKEQVSRKALDMQNDYGKMMSTIMEQLKKN